MFNVLNSFQCYRWNLDTKQYLIILSSYEARQKKKSCRDLKETIHWPKLDLNSFCISPLHNWYRRYRNSNADPYLSCHILTLHSISSYVLFIPFLFIYFFRLFSCVIFVSMFSVYCFLFTFQFIFFVYFLLRT